MKARSPLPRSARRNGREGKRDFESALPGYSFSRSAESADSVESSSRSSRITCQIGAIQPNALDHEGLDTAGFVDQLEHGLKLRSRQRHLGKHHVALEEVGDDPLAADTQQFEQHRRADAGAVASRRAMEE